MQQNGPAAAAVPHQHLAGPDHRGVEAHWTAATARKGGVKSKRDTAVDGGRREMRWFGARKALFVDEDRRKRRWFGRKALFEDEDRRERRLFGARKAAF